MFSLMSELPSSPSAGGFPFFRMIHRSVGGSALARWPPFAAEGCTRSFPAYSPLNTTESQSLSEITAVGLDGIRAWLV